MTLIKKALLLCVSLVALVSCNSVIYDYDEDCRQGLELRFVYDYNMEWADAFPSTAHCLTVLVYDADGNLVSRRAESSESLSQPGYTMTFDLPQGEYHVVAYAGMECDDASFLFDNAVESLPSAERTVSLIGSGASAEGGILSDTLLHDHLFGMADAVVGEPDYDYTKATVEMMKNTNHFRIMLQQVGGRPLQGDMFAMRIVDDNARFAHDNSIIPSSGVTYKPWSIGEAAVGQNADGSDLTVAYGELSTSRLVARAASRSAAYPAGESSVKSPRLIVTPADGGDPIIDIPLINYLLLFKSDRHSALSDQEFLDRMSQWNMIFFLDSNLAWIKTHIVVNDWTVRINDIEE